MPSGFISFPGVPYPKELIATRSTGTSPSTAILYAVPSTASPDTTGTATLSFGFNGTTINWTNCLMDIGTLQVTAAGQMQVFKIYDRRWRWGKAWIVGAYNVILPDGTVDPDTQKTIPELVSLLFAQIGGETVDTSLITSTEYPTVIWDHANCADELDDLLNARGYVLCLQTDNTVKIYPRDNGATLPVNDDVVNVTISINPPEVPLFLTAVGARTLVQSKLKCVPVGEDTDGSIKPVNDLSYMPVGGWDNVDMTTFATITDVQKRELALKTVGKWFQVTKQADDTYDLTFDTVNYCPGEITVVDAKQYFPLKKQLLSSHDNQFGKKQYDEAYVEIVAYDTWGTPPKAQNTPPFTRIDQRDWDLIPEWGIVVFKEPLLKQDAGPPVKMTFGDCYITCTYSIDATSTGRIKDRYQRQKNLGGIGEDVERVEQLQRTLKVAYTSGTATVSGITDNKTTIDTAADLFLNAAALKYSVTSGTLALYRGLYPFNSDGISLQIVWNCAVQGDTPWSTYVAQYCEALPRLPTSYVRKKGRTIRRMPVTDVVRQENYITRRKYFD